MYVYLAFHTTRTERVWDLLLPKAYAVSCTPHSWGRLTIESSSYFVLLARVSLATKRAQRNQKKMQAAIWGGLRMITVQRLCCSEQEHIVLRSKTLIRMSMAQIMWDKKRLVSTPYPHSGEDQPPPEMLRSRRYRIVDHWQGWLSEGSAGLVTPLTLIGKCRNRRVTVCYWKIWKYATISKASRVGFSGLSSSSFL